jgi:hypothetical protein
VGWAGLDKVPTRAEELADILEQRSEIENAATAYVPRYSRRAAI